MSNKVRIIIPCYKESFTIEEELSVGRTQKVLGKYGITFLAPNNLDLAAAYRIVPGADECRMREELFQGFSGYNKLMLSKDFYQKFRDYDFILICQQDVLVIEDRLKRFLEMPYDYYGAPIPHMGPWSPRLYTGNGGFSLRRVEPVLNLLEKHGDDLETMRDNEDIFFSNAGEKYPEEFRTAPIEVSADFASNMYHRKLYELNNNNVPMAIHGFCTGDVSFLKEKVYPLFEEQNQVEALDLKGWENDWQEFNSFIKDADTIAVYGAGDAGTVFKEVIRRKSKQVCAFVVSDGQDVPDHINGTPIYHLSDFKEDYEKVSFFIAISSRYKNLPDFEMILRNKGAKRVLRMSNELWHKGINELIKV